MQNVIHASHTQEQARTRVTATAESGMRPHAHGLRTAYRNNASKRPPGRYDFAGVKRRPGAFTVWPGRFLKKKSDFLVPPGDIKTIKRQTPRVGLDMMLRCSYFLMLTGCMPHRYTVVWALAYLVISKRSHRREHIHQNALLNTPHPNSCQHGLLVRVAG